MAKLIEKSNQLYDELFEKEFMPEENEKELALEDLAQIIEKLRTHWTLGKSYLETT